MGVSLQSRLGKVCSFQLQSVGIAYRKLLSECGSRKQASYPKVVQRSYLTPTTYLPQEANSSFFDGLAICFPQKESRFIIFTFIFLPQLKGGKELNFFYPFKLGFFLYFLFLSTLFYHVPFNLVNNTFSMAQKGGKNSLEAPHHLVQLGMSSSFFSS